MANKQTKRCSTSLITREMQIKTIMGFLFTPTRMPTIKKTIISIAEDVEKLELSYTAAESVKWCRNFGGVWWYLKNLKT